MQPITPNWEALAADGTDAFYVTKQGLDANEGRHILTDPSLHRWDCPSVLRRRPAYRLGRQRPVKTPQPDGN